MSDDKSLDVIHKIVKVIKPIAIFLVIGFLYLLFVQKFGIGIPCLFNKITGYKCPGCGMTHAMVKIWEGDFEGAMQYNALSLTVLPLVCIYMIYRFIQSEIRKRQEMHIWEYIILVILFVITVGYAYIRNKFLGG